MADPRLHGVGLGPAHPDYGKTLPLATPSPARRRRVRTPETKACAHCTKAFEPRVYHDEQQFCSQPCASRHRWCGAPGRVCPASGQPPAPRPDPTPPRSYGYKGRRPELKRCAHCAREFRPSLANPKQILCSTICASAHRACKAGRRACPRDVAAPPLDVTIQ